MPKQLSKATIGITLAAILGAVAFILARSGVVGSVTPRENVMPAEAQDKLKQSLGSVSGPPPPGGVPSR